MNDNRTEGRIVPPRPIQTGAHRARPNDAGPLRPVDPARLASVRAAHARAAGTQRPAGAQPGPQARRGGTDPDSTVYMSAAATRRAAARPGAAPAAPAAPAHRAQRAAGPDATARMAAVRPSVGDGLPPIDAGTAFGGDAEEPRPGGRRGLKIALAAAAGVLVVGYIAGAVAFSNIYYPGTSIAGVDVSLTGAGEAADRIEASVGAYTLKVSGLGFDWTYEPEAGTFTVDAQAEADAVLGANEALIWPVRLIGNLVSGGSDSATDPSALSVTYDEAAFEEALGAAIDQFNADRPGTFDAAGAFDEEAGMFTVARARASQKLGRDAVISAAKQAVASAETSLELDDSMYEPLAGGASDEELQAACDAANEIIGVNVDLKMGGTVVATLDGKTMTQWITFDENLDPTLNSEGLAAWIRQLAAAQLDTVGTERSYTRPDGKVVNVSGGTYGWISDEAALAELIQQAVANKQTGEIEIPTKQTAAAYHGAGGRDWGAYVDIDISEQHVRYYDANDNLLWESGCITGNPNEGNDTPTGIYSINNLERDVALVGKKDPATGEPEYVSYVDYWMSFIGSAIGLHDADWQASSSFSDPTAYTWTGSHGCVNLPPDKAAELFGILQVGDCVIVHN